MNDMGNIEPLLQTGLENKISFRFQAVRTILNHSRDVRYDNNLDWGNTGLETVIFFWGSKATRFEHKWCWLSYGRLRQKKLRNAQKYHRKTPSLIRLFTETGCAGYYQVAFKYVPLLILSQSSVLLYLGDRRAIMYVHLHAVTTLQSRHTLARHLQRYYVCISFVNGWFVFTKHIYEPAWMRTPNYASCFSSNRRSSCM